MVTQAAQPSVSLAPLAHGEWLHVPPLDELEALEAVDELEALEELDAGDPPAPVTGPPQTLVFGTQSWSFDPSAPATGVQVRPDPHAVCAQLGAQYWSPPNWPQKEPVAQSESCRQGGQAAAAPPAPDDAVGPDELETDAPCPDVPPLPDAVVPPLPIDVDEVEPVPPFDPHARSSAAGATVRQTARK